MSHVQILKRFTKLAPTEQLDLIKQLEASIGNEARLFSLVETPKGCPHCGSVSFIKYGKTGNKPRYQCNDCIRTFSMFTGKSVFYMKKKSLLMSFANMMLKGQVLSLRASAEALNISKTTAFEWRHKLLSAIEEIFTKGFKGIVETDDVFFRVNQKGRRKNYLKIERKRGIDRGKVAVQFTMDRYKTTEMKVVKLGRISVDGLKGAMNVSRFNKDNIVCSDSHRSITALMRQLALPHKKIHTKKGIYKVEEIYHVNTLNSYVASFRNWMKNFKGVSTKFLQHYLCLYQIRQILNGSIEQFLGFVMQDSTAYERSKNVELAYQKMLVI